MSPKAIAALVLEMKVPHEIQNDYCRVKWMLEQAATIAMKVSIDEIIKPVNKTLGEWKRY